MINEVKKFVFKGNQEELNEFIQKSEYYEVPIAQWEQLRIVYNKLDGLFQDEHGGWGDIFLYYAEGFKPPFKDSLDDIESWLNDMGAPEKFINQVCDLLFDNPLDTYNDDLTEEEIKQINEAMKNQTVIEIDPDYYDVYIKAEEYYDKIGKEFIEFDPTSIETQHNDLDNTYDENDLIKDDLAWIEAKQNHIDNCLKAKRFTINKPIYVYLAGKIKPNGWRQKIFDMREEGMLWGNYCCEELKHYVVKLDNNVNIVGPYFLSCDHSCYHGDNSHGVATGDPWGCYGEVPPSEPEVYDVCEYQIMKSNLVFAYINDDTCYGSLYEIGYAKAMGKRVVLIFDNENRMSKMWFMCQGVDIVDVLKDGQSLKEKFDEIIENISK